jgi:hypothetical protein
MNRQSFEQQMNERGNLIQITPDWKGQNRIPKGALIGFKGLTYEDRITAAYPFWREVGNQIQFVAALSGECSWTNKPGFDNTYFTAPRLFINADPIIIPDADVERIPTPTSIVKALEQLPYQLLVEGIEFQLEIFTNGVGDVRVVYALVPQQENPRVVDDSWENPFDGGSRQSFLWLHEYITTDADLLAALVSLRRWLDERELLNPLHYPPLHFPTHE